MGIILNRNKPSKIIYNGAEASLYFNGSKIWPEEQLTTAGFMVEMKWRDNSPHLITTGPRAQNKGTYVNDELITEWEDFFLYNGRPYCLYTSDGNAWNTIDVSYINEMFTNGFYMNNVVAVRFYFKKPYPQYNLFRWSNSQTVSGTLLQVRIIGLKSDMSFDSRINVLENKDLSSLSTYQITW